MDTRQQQQQQHVAAATSYKQQATNTIEVKEEVQLLTLKSKLPPIIEIFQK